MHYFGGKAKISEELSSFLNSELEDDQPFVDLFCGSCNIISKIDSNRLRIANDKHKYLIAMWKGLQDGFEPPKDISLEQYQEIRENLDVNPALSGFVGFGCSYAGKWFDSFAKSDDGRPYSLNAYNSTKRKFESLKDVQFYNYDYRELDIPEGSLVYCDIPYRGTGQYCKEEVGVFDHDDFYKWVDENCLKYKIYISEYVQNTPKNYDVVWMKRSKQDMRNSLNKNNATQEVLLVHKTTETGELLTSEFSWM
jgi:DNA adenine methylase